ncbi:helix-turn-helix domain-containing protein [Tateyamaria pelophila]|uniref:helix-turn-helix domain-containing protein n=1 Tax=Tateyamaria pelophila TaxID=328415 RepID=UPI001CBAECBC|nr:helix-turn-helix transcriptional regulator [Tateyamaria pelophila]
MTREALTGSRIRERRIILGVKQADLARQIGISASYLNLIEHNRRRIGGKLLLDIAGVLGVEISALTEGAEAALIAALRDAAQGARMPDAEMERAEEFAGRFPAWADALSKSHRRIAVLERMIETLNDRLTHDPELAASVHEVLSTAAAIRSTASILAEDKDLDPEWRDRFHANIDADSRRLAASSKALVGFLDAETGEAVTSSTPQEEVEEFLAARNYSFEDLEAGAVQPADAIKDAPELTSVSARQVAEDVLKRIVQDSERVAMPKLERALETVGADPVALAEHFRVSVPCIMRRMASLPKLGLGLVVSDRSGALLFRKGVPGFAIPRYGAACPLWPLFQVLGQPGHVLSQRIQVPGRADAVFDCYAAAESVGPMVINVPPLIEATMLIVPVPGPDQDSDAAPQEMGASCRICPRRGCPGRREPSILSAGF